MALRSPRSVRMALYAYGALRTVNNSLTLQTYLEMRDVSVVVNFFWRGVPRIESKPRSAYAEHGSWSKLHPLGNPFSVHKRAISAAAVFTRKGFSRYVVGNAGVQPRHL